MVLKGIPTAFQIFIFKNPENMKSLEEHQCGLVVQRQNPKWKSLQYKHKKCKEKYIRWLNVITARSQILSETKHVMSIFVVLSPWGRAFLSQPLYKKTRMVWVYPRRSIARSIPNILFIIYSWLSLHTAIGFILHHTNSNITTQLLCYISFI